jgi:H+/Cl- antiporter ClcA
MIMKFSFFSKIVENDLERRQMLAAACAAGVASVFGAPFGGVIFSVEVTATSFPVGNLWKSVLSALCASTLFSIWRYFGIKGTQEYTDFEEHSFQPFEYIFFGIEGILMGLIGALFVSLTIYTINLRRKHQLMKGHPYKTVIIVTMIVVCMKYSLNPGLFKSTNPLLTLLFKVPLDQWQVPNPLIHLILTSIGKIFITILSTAMV